MMKLEINKSLTERDKKLLSILAMIAILFGVGVGVWMPLQNHVADLKMQLKEEKEEKEKNQLKLISLPSAQKYSKELDRSLKKEKKGFYPMMESQDIDKNLTNMALQYGLNILSINISMPEAGEETTIKGYLEPETDQSAEASEGDTSANGESKEGYSCNGMQTAKIIFSLSGDKQKLQSILDRLTMMEPGIRIESFDWNIPVDTEQYMLSITMDLYMLEDTE